MKDLGVVLVAGAVGVVGAVAFQLSNPTQDPGETGSDDEVRTCTSLVVVEGDLTEDEIPSAQEIEERALAAMPKDCQLE